MNKGTLAFALDGQYFGVAFEDEKLKSGPLYPAVSLLHNAGCTLVTGRAPPGYFFEWNNQSILNKIIYDDIYKINNV